MSENTDALQRGYDAFGQRDLETIRSIWSDDIEWQGPDYEPLPQSGRLQGPDAVFEMFGDLFERWEGLSVVPDEFVEDGDTVVALGHLEGRAKESGEQVKVPFAHVWRMSDGKVERVQILEDTAVLAKALGV
ncbi:MAG TPA: nuclear transport factor 2 family protein [Thermoleophilaceae bacterium]|nr:nuclear transport factor 2 family protein [Thermoleophilaceae bacterium]